MNPLLLSAVFTVLHGCLGGSLFNTAFRDLRSPEDGSRLARRQVTSPCEDKSGKCGYWSGRGYCSITPDWMKEHCPCGHCPETTTSGPNEEPTTLIPTTSEVTSPPCEDKNEKCDYWSSRGYCSINPHWMEENCPCGHCEETTTSRPTEEQTTLISTTPEVTSAPCEDKDEKCDYWSSRGYCSISPDWMEEYCPCGHCEETTTSGPTEEPTTLIPTTPEESTEKPGENTTAEPTEQPATLKPTTPGGCAQKTKHGSCCVFPFVFNGKEFTSCIVDDLGDPWCSLTKDYDFDGEWGYCADRVPCLSVFNTYRTAYNLPELRWDQELANGAQAWAEVLRSENRLGNDESLDSNVGETLYLDGDAAADATCANAALSWFEQIAAYELRGFCESPPYKAPSAVSDFVQMMWTGTTTIGVGIDGPFLVARFYPRGNLEGKVASNVRCEAEPIV